jgi:hypothetical protein
LNFSCNSTTHYLAHDTVALPRADKTKTKKHSPAIKQQFSEQRRIKSACGKIYKNLFAQFSNDCELLCLSHSLMQKFYFRKPVSVYSQRFSPFSDFALAIFELFSLLGVSQQNLLSNFWQRRVDKLARKRTNKQFG